MKFGESNKPSKIKPFSLKFLFALDGHLPDFHYRHQNFFELFLDFAKNNFIQMVVEDS